MTHSNSPKPPGGAEMHGGASGEHVDSEALVDYVNGELSRGEAIRVDEHLGTCDDCVEKARRARNTVFFVDHLTARAHGAAYASISETEKQESVPYHAGEDISWLRRLATWLDKVFALETPQYGFAADERPPQVDVASTPVPTLVGDDQRSRETTIDVIDAPKVNPQGFLVFALRIPQAPLEAPQKYALQLLSVDERRPIGDPVEVDSGHECVASFELPERLREQWSHLGKQEPASWPFRFALRIRT